MSIAHARCETIPFPVSRSPTKQLKLLCRALPQNSKMYKKEKSVNIKGSTSALCNNLSVKHCGQNDTINYAIVHKSVVNLFSMSRDGSLVNSQNHRQIMCKEPSATHSNTIVLQARIVSVAQRLLLVITSQKGIQIFEADGSLMLFWYSLTDMQHGEMSACFGRGICGMMSNNVCVGNHNGEILVFEVPLKHTNITVSDTLTGHRHPITDLESDGPRLLSGDEMGNIILWHSGEKFQPILNISGDGSPCASVGLWQDVIVAAYGTGHLRVFSASSGQMTAEVTAHARWINALDVADNGLVITGAEDSFVRGWQLKAGPIPTIDHVFNECITDVQVQGVQFTSDNGQSFAVTGYDNNELMFYSKA